MVLLLFGPPGCGKGTQSRLITNWLQIPAISTGEMLRAEIRAETALGEAAKSIMASGGLVGDDLVNKMLVGRVSKPDCHWGFSARWVSAYGGTGGILDGVLNEQDMDSASCSIWTCRTTR